MGSFYYFKHYRSTAQKNERWRRLFFCIKPSSNQWRWLWKCRGWWRLPIIWKWSHLFIVITAMSPSLMCCWFTAVKGLHVHLKVTFFTVCCVAYLFMPLPPRSHPPLHLSFTPPSLSEASFHPFPSFQPYLAPSMPPSLPVCLKESSLRVHWLNYCNGVSDTWD